MTSPSPRRPHPIPLRRRVTFSAAHQGNPVNDRSPRAKPRDPLLSRHLNKFRPNKIAEVRSFYISESESACSERMLVRQRTTETEVGSTSFLECLDNRRPSAPRFLADLLTCS